MQRLKILMLVTGCIISCGQIGDAVAKPTSVQHALAKKHFELGQEYYQTADYAKAVEEFEQAYRLEPLPELAFNMGRCYEALNRLDKALEYFRLFLEKKPDAPERAVLELRIKNIEKRLAQQRLKQQQAEAARRAAVTEAEQKALARAQEQEKNSIADGAGAASSDPAAADLDQPAARAWRVPVGWSLLGVGAASLVTGIVFGAMVSSKNSEYDDAAAANKTYDELQEIKDSANQFQTIQVVTLVAGGLLAAAGGGLLIWHWADNRERDDSKSVSLFPFVIDRTAGIGLTAQF